MPPTRVTPFHFDFESCIAQVRLTYFFQFLISLLALNLFGAFRRHSSLVFQVLFRAVHVWPIRKANYRCQWRGPRENLLCPLYQLHLFVYLSIQPILR